MENVNFVKTNKCHDCNVAIIEEEGEIKNGYQLLYKDGEEEINVFKCKDCYEKNPSLFSFKKCEVYSRVVGYIRPVEQWNIGKKQEYMEREEYVENNN